MLALLKLWVHRVQWDLLGFMSTVVFVKTSGPLSLDLTRDQINFFLSSHKHTSPKNKTNIS